MATVTKIIEPSVALAQKTVGILGGGITGLSAAYYITKKYGSAIRPVIFEKSNRFGGWVRSVQIDENVTFETGPRSFRPVGLTGLNTLDLVEEIGLDNKVLFVPPSHPASKNRCIWKDGGLVRMPTDISIMFKATPPFKRALSWCLVKDLVERRWNHKKYGEDSLYNFVRRRFGQDVADYGIDPLIRGICTGDSKNISVKFTMGSWYELEQKWGSVTLGVMIRKLLSQKPEVEKILEIPGYQRIGLGNLAATSADERWAMWGLEGGTESLISGLVKKLGESGAGVDLKLNSEIKSVIFNNGGAEIQYTDEKKTANTLPVDYIISTLQSWNLAQIFPNEPTEFTQNILGSMAPGADVICTNVRFRSGEEDLPFEPAFGFLVPSIEGKKNSKISELLGIVFDSCVFDQGDGNTVFSVMSLPPADSNGQIDENKIKSLVRGYLGETLKISREPDDWLINYHRSSIPQYTIGHYDQIERARLYAKAANLPIYLAGSSFEGVSMNECIYSGRRAVENLPFDNISKDNL